MDTWVDNVFNDASLCKSFCLAKFVHTANTGDFARDACLQCDECVAGLLWTLGTLACNFFGGEDVKS